MENRQKFIDEALAAMERIERFVVEEIKNAPEDNPLIREELGDIRMHILKMNYKHTMNKPGKNRRVAGSGRRRRSPEKLDIAEESCRRNNIFGRRASDNQEFSIREEHAHKAPMFGRGRI